jgi:hypothetical protein
MDLEIHAKPGAHTITLGQLRGAISNMDLIGPSATIRPTRIYAGSARDGKPVAGLTVWWAMEDQMITATTRLSAEVHDQAGGHFLRQLVGTLALHLPPDHALVFAVADPGDYPDDGSAPSQICLPLLTLIQDFQ